MRIRIVRTVPGLVGFRPLSAGDEVTLDSPTALSLIGDGYAAEVPDASTGRSVPAERRETATAKRPGRPRREA